MFWTQPKKLKPKGDAMARVEAARGDMSCYVVGDGTANAYRARFRTGFVQRHGPHSREIARAHGRRSGRADRFIRYRCSGD